MYRARRKQTGVGGQAPQQKKQKEQGQKKRKVRDDDVADQPQQKKQKEQEQKKRKATAARKVSNTVSRNYTYAELCLACDGDWKGKGKLIPTNSSEFREMLSVIVPTIKLTSNQIKYAAASHDKEVKAHHGKTVRRERPYTDYQDSPELQYLRWVSTMAYAYLLCKKKKKTAVTEIQTLWDGEKLYISENTRPYTEELSKANGEWFTYNDELLPELETINKDFSARYKRHGTKLAALANVPHKNAVLKKPLTDHQIEYINDGIGGNKHAEIRLVEYWQKANPTGRATLYVGGVKRPCLACYCRLLVLERVLATKNITLCHKQRPGLFWPSVSALRDASEDARKKIAEHLIRLHRMYVTNKNTFLDSESEPDTSDDEGENEVDDEGDDDDDGEQKGSDEKGDGDVVMG